MTKYKVKSGDNLSLIAKQNNVSVEDLISANNIKDKNKISINQELIIPESKRLEGKEYVIKKGDTLYDISKKFNVGVNAVKKANEIKSDDIFAGDKIVIPENLSKAIIKENKNLKETFKITKKKEDNLKTINDFHSKNKEDYVVIDKKKGKLLLYNNGELKQTLDVGTGKGTSDIITGLTGITNNQTGAGIYTIAKQEEFQDLVNNPKNKKLYGKNILGYKNESGQVQGSFLHQIPEGNEERYGKIDRGNTHFSQGCINCKKKDFEQVVSNIKPNTKMYILPEEDDNVFEVKNNRLNFTTTKPKNIRGYNFTYDDKGNYLSDKVRQSTYKPLIIPKEKLKYAVFDNRNTSKQYEILQKNKESLMKDLNVDSDTYDTLAKQLMGHVKQETGSSYIRDVGERVFNNLLDVSNISIPDINIPFTDKKLFGNKSGKTYTAENSSRGDSQIRYNQIPENVRKKYGVNSPDDLDDIEKAIKVGMFLKKDGLQQVISKRDKLDNLTRENLTDFVPYQYNQAKLLQKNDTNPEKNRYVQNVLNFSNNLKQYGGNSENNMEQIVQQYIQAKGLNEQQAQQLIQELQKLDEQQLQQVLGKMQQQLQGNEEAMQYGGYEKWKKALPKNLQSTDTTLYNLRGAYEGGLIPEMNEDGLYHLGSRNPKTGELLKNPKHPTFNKMIEGEAQAGYEVYEKNGKLYSKPKTKQQYGGIPINEDGIFAVGKNPVVVPTRGTGQISMESVDFPISAYDADTMEYLETMQPNKEYQFDGVDNVLEIPKGKFGISKMQAGGKKPRIVNVRGKGGKMYEAELDPSTGLYQDQFGNMWEYNPQKKDAKVVYDIEQDEEQVGTKAYYENQKDLKQKATKTTAKTSPSKSGNEFVTGLKPMTTKKDMLPVYENWLEEWSAIDPSFKNKPFAEQQAFAKKWMKDNANKYYDGLKRTFKGYDIEKLTSDKKFGSITNQLRPSAIKPNIENGGEPVPNFVEANLPFENGNSAPNRYTGTVDATPISLPIEEKYNFEDGVNPKDAFIGRLDNRDMSGRYLSNMKLRNNEIKLPYFGQVDLKTPQLYQQDITPYINNLYTGYNSAAQNIDMNSAVGQAQALQLNANLDKSINDVSGSVYNQNLKAAIDWENQLTGIYNQQSQLDNQNRAAYSDGVDLVRTNKQNVDNQIDALAYEHKMKQIQNQNKMVLSTLLHPDFYTTDEGNGQMVLKRKYNKAPTANSTPTNTNPSIEAERDFWKDLALKNSKTKAAKYGIGKKKAC